MKALAVRPRVEFLELSVFDSGPGFAARAHGARVATDMPIGDEYDLVRRCFFKNVTTQPDPAHGLGLPRVMQLLKSCGGFMRLRTGRLSLYKWFAPGLPNPSFTENDLAFGDTDTGTEISAHAQVEGAAFTLLVPMGLGT